jgi:hypothetical protein
LHEPERIGAPCPLDVPSFILDLVPRNRFALLIADISLWIDTQVRVLNRHLDPAHGHSDCIALELLSTVSGSTGDVILDHVLSVH